MKHTFTARYVKIESGYMGQILEWPEVVTEGSDIEDCRASLKDALQEMIGANREMDKDMATEQALFEPLTIEMP
ncbi:MAG: type II toxin-antitoxin system HicB family antitoxin [Spirochaetaceae bacterium]